MALPGLGLSFLGHMVEPMNDVISAGTSLLRSGDVSGEDISISLTCSIVLNLLFHGATLANGVRWVAVDIFGLFERCRLVHRLVVNLAL